MSSKDIYKGDRWSQEIGDSLHKHHVGIICVTPENQTAPWVLFEAGAISKQLDKSKIYPLLLGMQAGELSGPLSQFQSTILVKEDFKKLIFSLNELLEEKKISESTLNDTFNIIWPKISKEFQNISIVKIEGTTLNISNVTL